MKHYPILVLLCGLLFSTSHRLPLYGAVDSAQYKVKAVLDAFAEALGGREQIRNIRSVYIKRSLRLLFLKINGWQYHSLLSDSTPLYTYTDLSAVHFMGKKTSIIFPISSDSIAVYFYFVRRSKRKYVCLLPYKSHNKSRKADTPFAIYTDVFEPTLFNLLQPEKQHLFTYEGETRLGKKTIIPCVKKLQKNRIISYAKKRKQSADFANSIYIISTRQIICFILLEK